MQRTPPRLHLSDNNNIYTSYSVGCRSKTFILTYHRIQCVRYRSRLFVILCLQSSWCYSQQIPAVQLSYSLSFHCTLITRPCGVSLSKHPTYLLNSIKQSPLIRTMTLTSLSIAQITSRNWKTNAMTTSLSNMCVLKANQYSSSPLSNVHTLMIDSFRRLRK